VVLARGLNIHTNIHTYEYITFYQLLLLDNKFSQANKFCGQSRNEINKLIINHMLCAQFSLKRFGPNFLACLHFAAFTSFSALSKQIVSEREEIGFHAFSHFVFVVLSFFFLFLLFLFLWRFVGISTTFSLGASVVILLA